MSIEITSTSDSKEAVTAAMADLASKPEEKPVDKPKEDAPAQEDPKEDEEEPAEEPKEDHESGEKEEPASEDEEEDVEVAAKDTTEKPKKMGGFQKKINKLNRELNEIRAKAQESDYWRAEALRKPQETKPETVRVDQFPGSTKPKADDFKTVEDFEAAMFDYQYQQRRTRELQEDNQKRVKSEHQTKLVKHSERVEEFKKTYEDFEDNWKDAVDKVGSNSLSITVVDLIMESDLGPAVMKVLSDDPKELKRICELTPLKAAKEFGKIEDRIISKKPATPTKEKKLTSKVSSPVKPVRAKGASTPAGYRDDMTIKEFEAWRKQTGKGA